MNMNTSANIYSVNREKLVSIVCSLFEWDLPDTCNSKIFERDLMTSPGIAAIYWEKKFGCFINAACTGTGGLDLYGMPRAYQCIGVGYTARKNADGIAWCVNNIAQLGGGGRLQVPGIVPLRVIEYYANALTDIDIAIQNNINAQKKPGLILVDDPKIAKTAKEAIRQAEAGEWAIVGSKAAFNGIEAKSFSFGGEFQVEQLQAARRNIFNEFLGNFGIRALEHEKGERMIVDEATSNEDGLSIVIESMLAPRRECCERFFKLYGEKIDVRPRFKNAERIY